MASRKLVRRLAVLGITTVLPLTLMPSAHAMDAGNYYLNNDWTGQCADLPGTDAVTSGTGVIQDTCLYNGSSDNQEFGLLTTRNINGTQLYEFVNVKSQLCLDLPGTGSDAPGTAVSLSTCNPNQAADNQEWYLDSFDGGLDQDLIVNYASGECLDVKGWASLGTATGSDWFNRQPLTIYTCSGSGSPWGGSYEDGTFWDDHVWNLQKV